jgi:hypothetical protein
MGSGPLSVVVASEAGADAAVVGLCGRPVTASAVGELLRAGVVCVVVDGLGADIDVVIGRIERRASNCSECVVSWRQIGSEFGELAALSVEHRRPERVRAVHVLHRQGHGGLVVAERLVRMEPLRQVPRDRQPRQRLSPIRRGPCGDGRCRAASGEQLRVALDGHDHVIGDAGRRGGGQRGKGRAHVRRTPRATCTATDRGSRPESKAPCTRRRSAARSRCTAARCPRPRSTTASRRRPC